RGRIFAALTQTRAREDSEVFWWHWQDVRPDRRPARRIGATRNPMTALLAFTSNNRLVHLATVDLAIIVFYFVLVLAIGFYLKERANTGEDFFMAGREMAACIAGLSFLAAILGSLELMGWPASAYQYGILAAHWYWVGAIPAMLFLALVMMPFYYISKT